jgi:hypothetical protein
MKRSSLRAETRSAEPTLCHCCSLTLCVYLDRPIARIEMCP